MLSLKAVPRSATCRRLSFTVLSAVCTWVIPAFGQTLDRNQVLKLISDRGKTRSTFIAKISLSEPASKENGAARDRKGKILVVSGNSSGPRMLRVDLREPKESSVVVDNDYTLFFPNLRRAHIGTTNNAIPSALPLNDLLMMLSHPDEIEKQFRITYFGRTTIGDGTPAHHLILFPIGGSGENSSELWVDLKGDPIRYTRSDKGTREITINLIEARANKKIDTSKFKLKLKKDTQISKEVAGLAASETSVSTSIGPDAMTERSGTQQGGTVLNQILSRMAQHNDALTSLMCDVLIIKFNVHTHAMDEMSGKLVYIRPTVGRRPNIRIDLIRPQETIALVQGRYILYRPKLNMAYTGTLSKADRATLVGDAISVLNMTRTEIRKTFNIIYLGESTLKSGVRTWHLQITPRTRASFRTAEAWVDGNGMPVQMRVTEHNNDSTALYLSALHKNSKINASVFRLDLPPGTKIVTN